MSPLVPVRETVQIFMQGHYPSTQIEATTDVRELMLIEAVKQGNKLAHVGVFTVCRCMEEWYFIALVHWWLLVVLGNANKLFYNAESKLHMLVNKKACQLWHGTQSKII